MPINWMTDLDAALAEARDRRLPVFLDFSKDP